MKRRRRSFARRLSAKEHWDMHYGPNMTPMVDVVMVILVFFMASTAVLGPEWMLKSALPVKTAAAQVKQDEEQVRLEVSVRMGGGVCIVDGAGIQGGDLPALKQRLTEAAAGGGAKLALLVTCAGDVPYEEIVRIHEMCHGLGITRIGLLEAPPVAPPGGASGKGSPGGG